MRRLALIAALLLPCVALAWGPTIRSGGGRMVRSVGGNKSVALSIQASPAGSTLVGSRGEAVTGVRAGERQCVVNGVTSTLPINAMCVSDIGVLVEPVRTQYLVDNCTAPATQTVTLAAAAHYLRVEGDGSISLAVGTAVATGLPCVATAASACAFTVTAGGTVVATVTGSIAFAQLENGPYPSGKICGAVQRKEEALSAANPLAGGSDEWCLTADFTPDHTWTHAGTRALGVVGKYGLTGNTAQIYTSAGMPVCLVKDAAGGQLFQSFPTITGETGKKTISCCSGAEIYIEGVPSKSAKTGTGTGIISTHPADLFLGSAITGYPFGGGISNIKFCRTKDPNRCGHPIKTRVDAMGDSITAYGDPQWTAVLNTSLGSGWVVFNRGVAAYYTSQILAKWQGEVKGIGTGIGSNTVLWLGGVNDIKAGEFTAAQTYATISTFVAEALADQRRVVLLTVLPFKGLGTWTADIQTQLLALNTMIRGTAGVIVVDAWEAFKDPADAERLNPDYDSGDHLHINDTGRVVMAQIIANAL